jgi:Protein of unknown function (DUF2924)
MKRAALRGPSFRLFWPDSGLGVTLLYSPENACMSLGGGPIPPPLGGPEMARGAANEQPNRAAIAGVAVDLAALQQMTSADLAEKYVALFGSPPRSRNKDFLRKRLAWRIQELAEGGLSERALARIDELGPAALAAGRPPARTGAAASPPTPRDMAARDPRLPAVGTVLTRTHGTTDHTVIVLDDGFEYHGERYRSLSKIARVITGTPWNGYLFFFGRANGTKGRR